MDRLSTELDTRYGSGDSELANAEHALLTGDERAVSKASAFYGLDVDKLQLQLSMLQDICKTKKLPLKSLQDVTKVLSDTSLGLQQLLTECVGLLRLVLTAPATMCTAERSGPRSLFLAASSSRDVTRA